MITIYWMWGDKPMSYEMHAITQAHAFMLAIAKSNQASEFYCCNKIVGWRRCYFGKDIDDVVWMQVNAWVPETGVPALFKTLNMIGV